MTKRIELEQLTLPQLMRIEENYKARGYSAPKWLEFSRFMLGKNYKVFLYRAKSTVSKYVYVRNPRNKVQVKIRFSNHKPNYNKEIQNDSDFYVGVFNNGVVTTESVIPLVVNRLEGLDKCRKT
jgi:hypothetical protein